jgi:hypothetical protein
VAFAQDQLCFLATVDDSDPSPGKVLPGRRWAWGTYPRQTPEPATKRESLVRVCWRRRSPGGGAAAPRPVPRVVRKSPPTSRGA